MDARKKGRGESAPASPAGRRALKIVMRGADKGKTRQRQNAQGGGRAATCDSLYPQNFPPPEAQVTVTDAPPFKFDEVNVWSEIKLEIVEKYGAAYTGAFSRHPRLKKIYVDAFSGAGAHISKSSGSQIDGSPCARALKISPPFDGFFFIDMNEKKRRT